MKKLKTKPNRSETLVLVEEMPAMYSAGKSSSMHKFFGKSWSNASHSDLDNIAKVKNGLSIQSLHNFMKVSGLSQEEISNYMHVSDRTLRRYSADAKLNTEQSERLFELGKLFQKGEEVFGNLDAFKKWLNLEILALDKHKPKDFLDTSMGIQLLITLLGRIEYGVFA